MPRESSVHTKSPQSDQGRIQGIMRVLDLLHPQPPLLPSDIPYPDKYVSYMTYHPLNITHNHNSIMLHIMNIIYIFHLSIMSSYMFSNNRHKTIINNSY